MNRMLRLQQPASVRNCPRCRYTGEGIGYFRRPGHLALLMGVSFFTSGVGGVVYWLMRRNAVVCPNCGLTWHEAALSRMGPPEAAPQLGRGRTAASVRDSLPSAGIKRRALGIMMLMIAVILIVAGIADFEPEAIVAGSTIGFGGTGMFFWGWRGLQERRAALAQALERRVLQLATRRGGSLTVTEVAAELDLSLPAAERVLSNMDDGFRVVSEVTDEGILLYEFPEVRHRRLGSSDPGSEPPSPDLA